MFALGVLVGFAFAVFLWVYGGVLFHVIAFMCKAPVCYLRTLRRSD